MSDQNPFEVNETLLGRSQVAPYAPALIHLLQGVIDVEDEIWNLVLSYRTPIESYFAQMGLALYVNETNGYAFCGNLICKMKRVRRLPYPASHAARSSVIQSRFYWF